jgi:hypothetical protein
MQRRQTRALAVLRALLAMAYAARWTCVGGEPEGDETVLLRVVRPTPEQAQHLVTGVPVSVHVDAHGDLRLWGYYHFVALLDGTQVSYARTRADLDDGEPRRGCRALLTLKPLQPGTHEIVVALQHSDGIHSNGGSLDSALSFAAIHVTVEDSPLPASHSQGRNGEGGEKREQKLAEDGSEEAAQFVPRDELEAKAWSAAGYYVNRKKNLSNVHTAGVLVLVVANYGYRQMLANWMCHADRVGIKYLVGVVDTLLQEWLAQHFAHVPSHLIFNSSLGLDLQHDTSYMALDMMRLVWTCHELVLQLLERGLSVLYMDVDVVLLRHNFAKVSALVFLLRLVPTTLTFENFY